MPYPPISPAAVRLRWWDVQIATDLPGQQFVDLAVPRHRRDLARGSIHVQRVATALAEQRASMPLEVAQEVDSPHAAVTRKRSRITSAPASDSSARRRFASRTRRTASSRF